MSVDQHCEVWFDIFKGSSSKHVHLIQYRTELCIVESHFLEFIAVSKSQRYSSRRKNYKILFKNYSKYDSVFQNLIIVQITWNDYSFRIQISLYARRYS